MVIKMCVSQVGIISSWGIIAGLSNSILVIGKF